MTLKMAQIVFVKDLRDKAHSLVNVSHMTIASDNACGFLSAMLEGIEGEKGSARYLAAGGIYAENTTLFVRLIVFGAIIVDPTLHRGLARNAGTAARAMKFIPAEVDGKPVDTWRPVSFTFNVY